MTYNFRNEDALQQHLRDSPAHAATYDCEECDQEFNSEEALQQHLRDSPKHVSSSVLSRGSHVLSSNGGYRQYPHAIDVRQYRTVQKGIYEGALPELVKAVYKVALSLR
jgi:hypothetical protein